MHVVHSFQQLQRGRTLPFDPWGKLTGADESVIADGWRGVWVGTKGDQQYIKKCFCFESSWVSENVCHRCKAPGFKLLRLGGPGACIPRNYVHMKSFNLKLKPWRLAKNLDHCCTRITVVTQLIALRCRYVYISLGFIGLFRV